MAELRWVAGTPVALSRKFAAVAVAAALAVSTDTPADVPAKIDPVPSFARADEDAGVMFYNIPEWEPETHNPLASIRSYFVPSGVDIPTDVKEFTEATTFAYSERSDVESFTTGVTVEMPYPDVPVGAYNVVPVFGYKS